MELQLDSAFFSDEMISGLEELKVEYSISVPFERFAELKKKIEKRDFWWSSWGLKESSAYFEERWKPKSWNRGARFVFIRTRFKKTRQRTVAVGLRCNSFLDHI